MSGGRAFQSLTVRGKKDIFLASMRLLSGMAQEETDLEKGIVGRGDWQRRWDVGEIGWQKSIHHPRLDKYVAKVVDGDQKRILVPLSGKSPDLLWFYNKGHRVVGVDMIEAPSKLLFEENQLEFMTEAVSIGKLHKSKDGRLQLYTVNLFDVTAETLGKFDIIWDCASLCTINIRDRPQYANLMISLMKPDARIYLNVRNYDPAVWPGPPHSFTEDCIKDIYGSRCTIEVLEKTEGNTKDAFIDPCQVPEQAGEAIKKSSYIFHYCYQITLKCI